MSVTSEKSEPCASTPGATWGSERWRGAIEDRVEGLGVYAGSFGDVFNPSGTYKASCNLKRKLG